MRYSSSILVVVVTRYFIDRLLFNQTLCQHMESMQSLGIDRSSMYHVTYYESQ